MRETVTMSKKDLDRLYLLNKVEKKELTQLGAARLLNLSERQVRNLLYRLRSEGPQGIVSRLVGKSSNRQLPRKFKEQTLEIIRNSYPGFGPTLATEKLSERDGIHLSTQTVRNWMIEASLWQPKKKRKRNLHPPRMRRPNFGELIQADGSLHSWFGPDQPKCNVIAFVDDATSALTALVFSETECLDAYFQAFNQHLTNYGRPIAFYTDHWSSFRKHKGVSPTQVQRALNELQVQLILAHSAQAKGRVERANRTLQDRLIKELFLRDIRTIEEANAFAPEFVAEYNKKFSKKPMNDVDVHRPLEGYDLARVLCTYESRSLSSSGTFQFNNCHYQLQGVSEYRRLAKKRVEVRVTLDGEMRVFLDDKEVQCSRLDEIEVPIEQLTRKETLVWKPRSHLVSKNHPWKRHYSNFERDRSSRMVS